MIKPGMLGYAYCDDKRSEMDTNNAYILQSGSMPEIVFFGDSITEEMPDKMIQNSSTTSRNVNNGISGDRLNFMVERFTADVLQLSPQKVHILGGINDVMTWSSGGMLLGFTAAEVVKYVIDHLLHLVQLAKREGIRVYVGSLLPINRPGFDNVLINQMVQKINMLLLQNQDTYGYILLDYYADFFNEADKLVYAAYTDDGLHPNMHGYETMWEELQQIFIAL